jgi:hypothetical protein
VDTRRIVYSVYHGSQLALALVFMSATFAFVFVKQLRERTPIPISEEMGSFKKVLDKVRKCEPMSKDELDFAEQIIADRRSLMAYSIPGTLFMMGCFYVIGSLEHLHGAAPSERTFLGVIPMLSSTNFTIRLLRSARLKGRLQLAQGLGTSSVDLASSLEPTTRRSAGRASKRVSVPQLPDSLVALLQQNNPQTRAPLGPPQTIRIAALVRAGAPRTDGEDQAYIRRLAEAEWPLLPILVHQPTMRIVDGFHRVAAAMSRGVEEIDAYLIDGSLDTAFIAGVEADVFHGLPPSLSDRYAAAARILQTRAETSDRVIAASTGLSVNVVCAIRRVVAAKSNGEDVPEPVNANSVLTTLPMDSELWTSAARDELLRWLHARAESNRDTTIMARNSPDLPSGI